eukprot:CAMPEP_0176306372 /NCGR_PEP_ID=MMETSP0121_2-20121125/63455_1 /TAXON_ID=160619 /ORGANISM="Kryptoperidinium foliaceum, Strain CCMP 1326" /LENGTH=38 /DNA_ID= /DNA_START= /DNA_END= /DNA_ORIENTATION=
MPNAGFVKFFARSRSTCFWILQVEVLTPSKLSKMKVLG